VIKINQNKALEFKKNLKIEYFKLKKIEFVSGNSLEDLIVEYTTVGNPIKNEKGEISNAIVFCHGLLGNCSDINILHDIIDSKILDDYFIISITTLGAPDSHSPSNTNLKNKFPKYSILDMVNFQKSFLKDKFNIKHLKGLIGVSMGGFEVLTWASNYPNDIDFLIPLVTTYKIVGQNYALYRFINNLIENDPEYNEGNYKKPLKSMGLANQVFQAVYPFNFSKEYFRSLSNDEIEMHLNGLMGSFALYDANDLILRDDAVSSYNIEDKLDKIIAKTLIIAVNQDQHFPPKLDAIPMSKLIKNSKLITYDSNFGHFGFNEISKVKKELREFLNKN
jgi:homoserine O-acetyltransferase